MAWHRTKSPAMPVPDVTESHRMTAVPCGTSQSGQPEPRRGGWKTSFTSPGARGDHIRIGVTTKPRPEPPPPTVAGNLRRVRTNTVCAVGPLCPCNRCATPADFLDPAVCLRCLQHPSPTTESGRTSASSPATAVRLTKRTAASPDGQAGNAGRLPCSARPRPRCRKNGGFRARTVQERRGRRRRLPWKGVLRLAGQELFCVETGRPGGPREEHA
jgi:hypothetical protein